MFTDAEIRQLWEKTSRLKNKVQTELDATTKPQPELRQLNDAFLATKQRIIELARARGVTLF